MYEKFLTLLTYQSFWGIPSEKRFTGFTRDGIEVVAQSPVPANPAVFVLLVLTTFVHGLKPIVVRAQIHGSVWVG